MKIKALLITVLLSGLFSTGKAQDYETAVGVRLGFAQSLSIKHFVGSDLAIEGLLGRYYYGGFNLAILGELHREQAFGADGLWWYYGGGGHLGSYGWTNNNPRWKDQYNGNRLVIGLDGILGLEYNIKEIPFNVSLDFKPTFDLIGWQGYGNGGAFSIRYIFR
jgi:hypothetical protein